MKEESLIYYGGAVKTLGDNRLGGYLVRYGDPDTVDLEGDYFSADTDLGIETGAKVPVYYQHGYDPVLKNRRLARAEATFKDDGVWLETQLQMRDEYEQHIMELAEAGKLGWSSGAAGHLVEVEAVGKSWHIKSWPIAEASLTPTPAEPRNSAISLKSIFDKIPVEKPEEETKMTEEVKKEDVDIKAMFDEFAKEQAKILKETIGGILPEVKTAIKVEKDETDRSLEAKELTPHEFFTGVKAARVDPYRMDKRFKAALGQALDPPADGGYLVPEQMASGIIDNMWGTGSLLAEMSPITVTGNNMTFNLVKEESRANGSRGGGILGYWLDEADAKTKSQAEFRQLNLKLKKVAALVYATDELLEDASALPSWINRAVPQELRFQVEDAIINGGGTTKPLGALQAPALVKVPRKTANDIDAKDIFKLWSRRYPGASDYVWLGHSSILPSVYSLMTATTPVYMPPGGVADAPYGRILGRPFIETEYNAALGTQGDLLLFSPSQYAMIHKGGVKAATSIHVQFVTDETAFRFVYRVDGAPMWNAAVTPYKGTDTISPFVTLKATTS